MIRRALRVLLRPVRRLVLRLTPVDDPWERLAADPPLAALGVGARRDFAWYFEGDSIVPVGSLDDVFAWLAGCKYASDPHLFQEPDFWQHPCVFEHLRHGDCEDFALWAWRKLVELGYDADFVVGRCVPPECENGRHAWIVFRRDGTEYVFEPAWAQHPHAVCALADVRAAYIPEFGVGRDRRPFAFAGYLYFLKNPHLGRPRSRGERPDPSGAEVT